ncbi:hypothetical protein CAPTEDRAFT_200798 [Capitella teleta]|uniref:Uncharacterized protein n=1 Tax=Capitella teleta TaxID=283909 RepID=R7V3U9_CAPTE|nr:hypothetical protein CAPTEDRAFT_200798 [Capitella teleta]|eukprot:ELU10485.1 hypothetical protein CAPTEDRAFT_200798 [Capitella teleta]
MPHNTGAVKMRLLGNPLLALVILTGNLAQAQFDGFPNGKFPIMPPNGPGDLFGSAFGSGEFGFGSGEFGFGSGEFGFGSGEFSGESGEKGNYYSAREETLCKCHAFIISTEGSTFERNECKDATAAKEAICRAKGDAHVVDAIIRCVNYNSVCKILRRIALSDLECLKLENEADLAHRLYMNACKFKDLPWYILASLPEESLRPELQFMEAKDLKNVLLDIADNPRRIPLTLCSHIVVLAEEAENKRIPEMLEGLDSTKFLQLLPFLPELTCFKMTASLTIYAETFSLSTINVIDQLKLNKQNFGCTGKIDANDIADSVASQLETVVRSNLRSSSMYPVDLRVTIDNYEYVDRIISQNNGARQCKMSCGSLMMEQISYLLDLNNRDTLDRLGTLKECMSQGQIADIAGTGDCRDFTMDMFSQTGSRKMFFDTTAACLPSKNLADVNSDDLVRMGCVLLGLPPTQLNMINVGEFCSAVKRLDDCLENEHTPVLMMDYIGRKCGQSLRVADALKMGRAVAHVPRDSLLKMSSSDLGRKDMRENIKGGLAGMKSKPGSGPIAFSVAHKMSLDKIADSEEMSGTLSVTDLKEKLGRLDINALNDKLDLVYTDPKLNEAQNRMIMSEIFNDHLQDGSSTLSYTDIWDLKSTVQGLSRSNMAKFNSSDRYATLGEICQYNGYSGHQPYSGIANTVCAKINKAKRLSCEVPRKHLSTLTKPCHNVLGQTFVPIKTTESIGSLIAKTFDEASDPGELSMAMADIGRLRCVSEQFLESYEERIIGEASVHYFRFGDTLQNLGPLAFHFLPVEMKTSIRRYADFKKLAEHWATLLDGDADAKAEDECCRRDNSDEFNRKLDDLEAAIRRDIVQDIRIQSNLRPMPRGKRDSVQVTGHTCLEIKLLGVAISAMTLDDLNLLTDEDFFDCLPHLGLVEKWSSDIQRSLFDRAIRSIAFGSACNLDSPTLADMGSLNYALTTDQIACLNLDDDSMGILGACSGWSYEQKEAFLRRFMLVKNIVDYSALSATDLVTLGHFLGGIKSNDLGTISRTAYSKKIQTKLSLIHELLTYHKTYESTDSHSI